MEQHIRQAVACEQLDGWMQADRNVGMQLADEQVAKGTIAMEVQH